TATGIAHSKLILIGEHAVVHGQPAIALPFPLVGVEAMVEHVPGSIQIDSSFYHGPLSSVPSALKGFANSIQATLDYLSIPAKDLLIQIKSSIPPGKGNPMWLERSEEHTSELQSRFDLVCRLLLDKKKLKK